MNQRPTIKRGVSLYSFQEEFFLRQLSLEDCIATSAKFGAYGIETLGEQMMPGFPNLSDAFYDQWHGWMHQYGTTPVCHDLFLDITRLKDKPMNQDEMLASIIRDLKHAHRLGCSVVRVIVNTPPEVLERAIPFAEKYDVKMGVEVHSPWHLDHAWIQRHLEVAARTGTKHLGVIPDLGIFIDHYPRVQRDFFIRQGATERMADYICEAYHARIFTPYIIRDVKAMGGNATDIAMAESLGMITWTNPRRMLDYMPYIFHIHAKFYEMSDDYAEYSIPYRQIIAVLQQGGYTGYMCSEYEGNRHIQDAFDVDSVEQVRRHQEMMSRLLAESDTGMNSTVDQLSIPA